MRKLILRSFQSPGDIVMLTAAVRDLHAACPGQFVTDVRTSADALWEHNPHLTLLGERDAGIETLDMHYPLVHQSNQRPYHFLHGFVQYLEDQLQVRIPLTRFQGDIHLSDAEREAPPDLGVELPENYWIIIAGGKYDFTAKWWNPDSYQQVVDHFKGRIQFVQCGEAGHWHPPLQGTINLIGKTTTRQLVHLMHYADGVVCPVTFAMHLSAAVESRPNAPRTRPCVVIAGGREPTHWEAYPGHQFISNAGMLSCCQQGGCWKSRCQLVGDGDDKDRHNVCEQPVQIRPDLRIPRCLDMISPADVICRIETYFEGGVFASGNGKPHGQLRAAAVVQSAPPQPSPPMTTAHVDTENVLIDFSHGLGDAVQLTVVLKHLRRARPTWNIDVAALAGKESAFHGLCRQVLVRGHDRLRQNLYSKTFPLKWDECHTAYRQWPSTKVARCLQEVFDITPDPQLCSYSIHVREATRNKAHQYLEQVCQASADAEGRYPAVLIHYEGNTSAERKNLTHELARQLCDVVIAAGATPIILDWDHRSPWPDNRRIFNPGPDHDLWGGKGTGDAETLAALIEASRLMIGVDSGPLHVAGATTTPTIAVWLRHHPVHYFDLADNVIHLVPGDHEKLAHGRPALAFFQEHYQHQTYKLLHVDLPVIVECSLTGESFQQGDDGRYLNGLSSHAFNQRYYEEHRLAGLDYLGYGDWQRQYGRWIVESLNLHGKRMLDVGCACGSILRGLGEAGAIVQGVDLNEHMIRLGREHWLDMAPLLFICDAVNLHLFADDSWDAIHTAQVAEHWKPELVPFILRELARVVVPGGLLFCALDTEELFARQNRRMEYEDPTHVCIRPRSWWLQQLREAGWHDITEEVSPALMSHAETFLTRYDWDWFVARLAPSPVVEEQ